MFDDLCLSELCDKLKDMFYADVQTVGDQNEMLNLANEIMSRVINTGC